MTMTSMAVLVNRRLKGIVRRRWLAEDGDLSDCPYFRGSGICSYGCWEEPGCQTDMPLRGWPLEAPWIWTRAAQRIGTWVRRAWLRLTCRHRQTWTTLHPTGEPGVWVRGQRCRRCNHRVS